MTNLSPRDVVLAFIADITAAHAGEAIDPFRRFADDGVMIIPGTTPLSGRWRKPSFYTQFLPRAMQLMGTKPGQGLCVSRVIAEGNRVVALARGRGSAISGRPYNNIYFLFFEVRGQEIVRYFEGFDSSLAHQAIFDVHLERPFGALDETTATADGIVAQASPVHPSASPANTTSHEP